MASWLPSAKPAPPVSAWTAAFCAGSWSSVVISPMASWLPSAKPAPPVSAWTAAFCAGATAVPCRKDFKASTNVSSWSSPRVPSTISFPGTTGNVSDLLYLHFMSAPPASTSPLRFHWCIDAGSDKRWYAFRLVSGMVRSMLACISRTMAVHVCPSQDLLTDQYLRSSTTSFRQIRPPC